MELEKKLALIEGLLFINGDAGVEIKDFCYLVDSDEFDVKEMIQNLQEKYESDNSCGLSIQNFAKSFYRMITKKEHSEYYKKLVKVKTEAKLSSASLETLSIIAYKGPITRSEIEEIRGVNCESIIYKLKIRNLIADAGQSDKPGKSMLYEVTKDFMKYFNIQSLDELPRLEEFNSEDKELF